MNTCFISKIFDEKLSNHTAFNYVDRSYRTSYKDLREEVGKQQMFLKSKGVKPGDYVAVAFDSEEKILVIFLSLMSIGAIMVPLNPHLTNDELEKILRILSIKFFYTSDDFILEHSTPLKNNSQINALFTLNDPVNLFPNELNMIHFSFKEVAGSIDYNFPNPSQIVSCHFTMKGFGGPLGVEHTYDDYCQSLQSCDDIFNFEQDKKVLGLLPCYPIFGLVTNLLYPLTKGCEIIIQDKKLKNLLKAISEYKITHVNLVPAIIEKLLLEAQKVSTLIDLSHVCFVTGGSYLTPDLYFEFSKTFNSRPVQGYGLTETLVILTNTPKDPRPGTLGKLMRPGVEMQLFDAKGFQVPKGKAGEICFRGQGIIKKYIGSGDHREQLFRSGWLRTGDIAYESEDGHITYLGRRLNFTKIQANMVDLKEIEETAKELNGIKLSRSYVTNDKGREKLCLALFVSKDFSMGKKEISDFYRSKLSAYKVPSIIKIFKNNLGEVL